MSIVKSSMTLEEARKVKWVFREIKGQEMGQLLDEKKLTSQDLGFAFERAYDPKVKEAAKILLLDYLAKESPSTKNLQLINSDFRSFAEREQLNLALYNGAIIGLFAGAYLFWGLQRLIFPPEPTMSQEEALGLLLTPSGILGTIILFSIIFVLPFVSLNWLSNKLLNQLLLHRKGQEGEERVLNSLYANLDGSWTVFKNLELKGYKNDFDFVLVGDTGIWVLEVKSYSGNFKNVGRDWQRRFGSMWLPALGNPEKQVRNAARTINNTLKNHGIEGHWINPIIIWANPDSKLELENPNTPVYLLDELNKLKDLSGSKGISPEQKLQIIETLTKAAVKKENQEKASS